MAKYAQRARTIVNGVEVAKHTQRTKVIVNGVDVSVYVYQVKLDRSPGLISRAEIVFHIQPLQVEEDGTLVVNIETRPEAF